MKVYVVADAEGRIISISRLGDVGEQVSGIARAGVVPAPGQHAHLVELPEHLRGRPLLELHERLRLDTSHERPRLVPLEEFVEPYLRAPHLSQEEGS
jgi:hypothetical protein